MRLNETFEKESSFIVHVSFELFAVLHDFGEFAMAEDFWTIRFLDFDFCQNAIVAGDDAFR
jgi:hypothetical protein